jgi:hypothetical protein
MIMKYVYLDMYSNTCIMVLYRSFQIRYLHGNSVMLFLSFTFNCCGVVTSDPKFVRSKPAWERQIG